MPANSAAIRINDGLKRGRAVRIFVDGFPIDTYEGETIATALMAAGRIWDAMRAGSRSLAEIKPTRVAMGPCQGRVCEATVSTLMARAGITPGEYKQLSIRPPLKPLPIAVLANNT